jgi:3-oxoacyl-[acyl-carrier protein] reductase
MNNINFPNWVPQVEYNSKILVVGASGGIGKAVVNLLLMGPKCVIGFHRSSSNHIAHSNDAKKKIIDLKYTLNSESECCSLIDKFTETANGVDGLVVLCGGITNSDHWKNINPSDWENDIKLNLNIPFYLARAAMDKMENGGRIILVGTESAVHGGSPTALAYGVAKRGIECLVQGLAREGAEDRILVNGIRLGFIKSGFHERWQEKSSHEIDKRIGLIPLGRGGEPEEVAAFIVYLLSGWSKFITGQMFPITGGDWL